MNAPIETDALVIGAGPVGLFQAFQLGLQGISCHLVDALPHTGGQCSELYADKPIYDIPGIPLCTGSELIERLTAQLQPFPPTYHLGQQISTLSRLPDSRFAVGTAEGQSFITRCVFIAAGVGAFVPRRLAVEGLLTFEGQQVFHALPADLALQGQNVLVAGDNDTALSTAIQAAKYTQQETPNRPASVTLMHRRDQFQASPELVDTMRQLCAQGAMRFVAAQPTGCVIDKQRLTGLEVLTANGEAQVLRADVIVASLGLSPRLGPLADWGLALERKQLPVQTDTFSTHESGIFAVGDINTYPGKKKLILCGFHEATLAAFGAAALLNPEQKMLLQYTTTSTLLHQRLGIA
jgi:thioredoxin reductase (NADPH)